MTARFDALGIVTKDIARSLRFYGLLGVPVPAAPAGDDHVEATLPNGLRLMWDHVSLMKKLDPKWQEPAGHRTGMAFRCDSPGDVDALHAVMVREGFESASAPWDAFWGQRYAQLLDPDGNKVDLFAPL